MDKRIEKGQTSNCNQSNTPLQDVNKDKSIVSQSKAESVKLNPQFDDLNPQAIIDHVQNLKKVAEAKKQNKGLLKVKTANKWLEQAKTTPIPEMLFGEFWHEGEICILFADSNLGKSILAVQIADSISKGDHIPGFQIGSPKASQFFTLILNFRPNNLKSGIRYKSQ